MDIQWSGAIDFSPLFRPTRPMLNPAKAGPSGQQTDMLQQQRELTSLLDRANDPFDNPLGIGNNVNIIA